MAIKKTINKGGLLKKCPRCKIKTFLVSIFGSICGTCFYEEKDKFKKPRVPHCAACWDKGYASYLSNFHQAADFIGDKSHDKVFEKRNYCPCKIGQKLKKLESK